MRERAREREGESERERVMCTAGCGIMKRKRAAVRELRAKTRRGHAQMHAINKGSTEHPHRLSIQHTHIAVFGERAERK